MTGQEAYYNLGISNDQDQTMRNYFSMFPEELIASVLDAFIINMPMSGKVGGDGFWVHQGSEDLIIALFDCMGHGHLASMMTRVYTQLLDKIVKEESVTDPGTILRYLHHQVSAKFKDKVNRKIESSADFSIIKISMGVRKIEYSGAKIGLTYVSGGEVKELAAKRLPIGDLFDYSHNYDTSIVPLKDGVPCNIYLATDGLKDQEGGPNGKRLGKKAIHDLLKKTHGLPMVEQKEIISNSIKEWRGNYLQTDDLLILGLSI